MTPTPYVADVFAIAVQSSDFRRVLATAEHTQLVAMTLRPGEEIGEEVHDGIDQVLLVLDGSGVTVLEGERSPVGRGSAIVVPAGVRHNVVADTSGPLRILTVYGPPDHAPDTVHPTKADAESDEHDQPPAP